MGPLYLLVVPGIIAQPFCHSQERSVCYSSPLTSADNDLYSVSLLEAYIRDLMVNYGNPQTMPGTRACHFQPLL